MKYKLLFLVVITIGIILRIYKLDVIPMGVNPDEASIGYNAYSLLETGKDRYGKDFPLAFRSLGTYLLPIYTYLTIIPVYFYGPTAFSVHLISAISSIILIFVTLMLVSEIKMITLQQKLLITLLISISPWAVYFGRAGHEISLSVTLFIISVLFFIKSLSRPKLIAPALGIAGLSGATYYTEHYLLVIFLSLSLWIFRKKFIGYRKYILIGLVILVLTQLPQLLLIRSEAFSRRLEQVNYLNNQSLSFTDNILYILNEFSSHYLEYFSPRSLFFDQDPQSSRSIPDLSVFYIWMVVPLLFGLKYMYQNKSNPVIKILIVLLIIAPIPAALTKDPFYSLRALLFFWILTIVIAFGMDYLLKLVSNISVRTALILILVLTSLVSFYNSYFILLNYERSQNYGYEYAQLVNKLKEYSGKRIVIDSSRVNPVYIWVPFYARLDPLKYQSQTNNLLKNDYYDNTSTETDLEIDNLSIRPIIWKSDVYNDEVLVGDQLSISPQQVIEHKLIPLFQIIGPDNKIKLIAYQTDPKQKCQYEKDYLNNLNCKKILSLKKNE